MHVHLNKSHLTKNCYIEWFRKKCNYYI